MVSQLVQALLPFVYIGASYPIFSKVYDTSRSVIDEEFHLQQGLHYCNKQFSEWDPKITTFPGLYVVSCILIPLNFCNVFGLRLISLVASATNVYLIFKIRERKKTQINVFTLAVESISIAILPPLYFFCHLYYTDVLSMTFFLCMYYFWDKKSHNKAAVFGGLSVLVRQTNVVWVVALLGTCFFDELIYMYAYRKSIKKKSSVFLFNVKTIWDIACSWGVVLQSIVNTLMHFYGYIIVVLVFVSFVIANGSIVVGDKSAHEATLHIPQLFYFGVFTNVFGAPLLFEKARENFFTIMKSWKSYGVICIVVSLIVGLNTMTHPYLLADNRHYIFYIWNRFYGKYGFIKFAAVPLFVFSLKNIQTSTSHLSDGFQIMFYTACFSALCTQQLLEVRYFLIPYMIVRLNLRIYNRRFIMAELMYNVIINVLTFAIFFKKEIFWKNYTEPQRMIW